MRCQIQRRELRLLSKRSVRCERRLRRLLKSWLLSGHGWSVSLIQKDEGKTHHLDD